MTLWGAISPYLVLEFKKNVFSDVLECSLLLTFIYYEIQGEKLLSNLYLFIVQWSSLILLDFGIPSVEMIKRFGFVFTYISSTFSIKGM